MKFNELKENEPLEIIEVTNHMLVPGIHSQLIEIEDKQIQMKVFTDGEIEKESEETSQPIKEYYINKRKYKHKVDTLKTKNIYFKNHSYVIVYTIAKEFRIINNIRGWFNIEKDVSIYLKNPKDKNALKSAKQVIKEIANHNRRINYSSVLSLYLSRTKPLQQYNPKTISKNVYNLKK